MFWENKNLRKGIVMEQKIHITLGFKLATGKVNLNEIVYRLKEVRDTLMLQVLENILCWYDELITERLSRTDIYPSKARKGLGRHVRKADTAQRYCRGRKVRKIGYRDRQRRIKTVFGTLVIRVRQVECCRCGKRYAPLLNALDIPAYAHRESNVEHAVTEAVIDTNYRRLIDGRSIDISLGGIHNIVVGSDIGQVLEEPVDLNDLAGIMADGTGVKQKKGSKGELRAVIGITQAGRVKPLGCFTNTDWSAVEAEIRKRLKQEEKHGTEEDVTIPFVYDGEPGLDQFLAGVTEAQRCTWHASRGLYHALWEDGVKKKQSQPQIDKIKHLVGIELPAGDFELLQEADKQEVRNKYTASKEELEELIKTFQEKGYRQGATYLENIAKRLFTHIEIWLKTGVIAPKTTSLLERVFREIGRRLKSIAWGWSDMAVTNLSKMIMIRQYSRNKWEQFWKEKLGIKGFFEIQVLAVSIP
jgi:hypothetical protein